MDFDGRFSEEVGLRFDSFWVILVFRESLRFLGNFGQVFWIETLKVKLVHVIVQAIDIVCDEHERRLSDFFVLMKNKMKVEAG